MALFLYRHVFGMRMAWLGDAAPQGPRFISSPGLENSETQGEAARRLLLLTCVQMREGPFQGPAL